MVDTLGAPVIEAQGNNALKTSVKEVPGTGSASTVEVSCQTVSYFSVVKRAGTLTVPTRAIRPRSLRTMSTIMRFSARSFSEDSSWATLLLVVGDHQTSPAGAFHRLRDDPPVPPLEEQLRGGRSHNPAPGVDQGSVSAGLGVDQIAIERLGGAFEGGLETESEIDLIGVACPNALADVFDG